MCLSVQLFELIVKLGKINVIISISNFSLIPFKVLFHCINYPQLTMINMSFDFVDYISKQIFCLAGQVSRIMIFSSHWISCIVYHVIDLNIIVVKLRNFITLENTLLIKAQLWLFILNTIINSPNIIQIIFWVNIRHIMEIYLFYLLKSLDFKYFYIFLYNNY